MSRTAAPQRPRRRHDPVNADHAGLGIALLAADAHVEVAAIPGAQAREQIALADGGGRVLGAAGAPRRSRSARPRRPSVQARADASERRSTVEDATGAWC
jgi:hypothetical protein